MRRALNANKSSKHSLEKLLGNAPSDTRQRNSKRTGVSSKGTDPCAPPPTEMSRHGQSVPVSQRTNIPTPLSLRPGTARSHKTLIFDLGKPAELAVKTHTGV